MKAKWIRSILFTTSLLLLGSCALFKNEPDLPASTYPPGSVGYLYEDCNKALNFTSIDDFQNSYCGSFFAGFNLSFYATNMIIFEDPKGKLCENEIRTAQNKTDNRFLSPYDQSAGTSAILKDIKNLYVHHIIHFLIWSKYKLMFGGKNILQSTKREDFLLFLYENDWNKLPKESLEKITNDISGKPLMGTATNMSLANKIMDGGTKTLVQQLQQCSSDLKNNPDELNFATSLCGAEINGSLVGTNSNTPFLTRELQELEKDNTLTECKSEAIKLYKQLRIPESPCTSINSSLRDIAKEFVDDLNFRLQHQQERYEDRLISKRPSFGFITYYMQEQSQFCHKHRDTKTK